MQDHSIRAVYYLHFEVELLYRSGEVVVFGGEEEAVDRIEQERRRRRLTPPTEQRCGLHRRAAPLVGDILLLDCNRCLLRIPLITREQTKQPISIIQSSID